MLKGTISRHISLVGIGNDKPSIIPFTTKLLAKFLGQTCFYSYELSR